MKVVFFSNFMNHHQLPLCMNMQRLTDNNFVFVATETFNPRLVSRGYENLNNKYPFILASYESSENNKTAYKIANDSDVLIIGSAPNKYALKRIKNNKIVFRYEERPIKDKNPIIKRPIRFIKWSIKYPTNKPVYCLCASAYTYQDYASFGVLKNKCYKWGYFPEVKKYESINTLIDSKNKNSILWTGRFLDWKHPEAAIAVSERLKKTGYNFTLNLIGQGELYEPLKKLIEEKNLTDYVNLLGAMPPEEVRRHMEESEIFLFTSDRNEGWGAVLNESMNSGCAVVASNAIGSVPYLIENGKNGLVYQDGNIDELYEKTKYLLDHPLERKALGAKAYETMVSTWNADVAAERLLVLAEKLMNGEETPYTEGPCSKA